MKKIIFAFVIFSVFISCTSLPDRSDYNIPDRESLNFEGLQFGLCHAGYSRSDEEYALLDALGAKWIRIDFRWSSVEKVRGEWDFSVYDDFLDSTDAKGKKVLAILDYDTPWLHEGKDTSRQISPEELPLFLEYVKVIAERYGDRVGAFEIWNEPNTKRFWTGSDEQFFELTRQSLDVLKMISPETPVAVGSLFYNPIVGARGYLKKMIKSGVLDKADALSLHPYVLSPSVMESRIHDARELIADAGYATPIWITEAGFPTGGSYPNKVKLEKQGIEFAEALIGLSASGVELITWYELFDSKNPLEVEKDASSETFFGMVWPDYTWKPGAYSYSVIANELSDAEFTPDVFDFDGNNLSSLYQAHFLLKDGTRKIILYSKRKMAEVDLSLLGEYVEILDILTGEKQPHNSDILKTVGKDPIMIIVK